MMASLFGQTCAIKLRTFKDMTPQPELIFLGRFGIASAGLSIFDLTDLFSFPQVQAGE
jgi:hypothetical protein